MNDVRDQVVNMLESIPGASLQGNRVTVRPRDLRLRANRNGKGYVTSYTVSIGCAEAAQAGFLDADKNPLPLEKIVDPENHCIIYRLKP